MRLVVFGDRRRVGVVSDEHVVDVSAAYGAYLGQEGSAADAEAQAAREAPAELGAFIRAGHGALRAAQVVARFAATPGAGALCTPLAAAKLCPPIADNARIFGVGNNYPAHAAGARGEIAADAAAVDRARAQVRSDGLRGFITFPENCIGPGEPIVHPARTDMLDFEGEIAAVIGRRCKDVTEAEAAAVIYGFVLVNDCSARRAVPTADNPTSRFARDKNFDHSKPAGPFLAVGEFADPQDIRWETKVNGQTRQRGHTREMIFSFAEVLSYLSEDLTLLPGDVICAGTTSGTIMDSTPLDRDGNRDPAAFLKPGDVVEIANPILGTLRNSVVAKRVD